MEIFIDTETTGLDSTFGCRPFSVGIFLPTGPRVWTASVNPHTRVPTFSREDRQQITSILSDVSLRPWVLFNANFDLDMLAEADLLPWHPNKRHYYRPYECFQIEDVQVLAHIWRNDWPHNLKDLASLAIGISRQDEKDLLVAVNTARRIAKTLGWRIAQEGDPHFPGRSGARWSHFDYWLPATIASHFPDDYPTSHPWHHVCSNYLCNDLIRTMLLWRFLYRWLDENPQYKSVYNSRMEMSHVIQMIERNGFSCSVKSLVVEQEKMSAEKEKARESAKRFLFNGSLILPKFNLNSPAQVGRALNELSGHRWFASTNKKHLATVVSGLIDTLPPMTRDAVRSSLDSLQKYRTAVKLDEYMQSYMKWMHPKTRKIYPRINLTGTNFTRQSSNDPNLQNVPKDVVRRCFGPHKGRKWWDIDFSNLELRIWAYTCGSPTLIAAFEEGVSIHKIIALELHPHLRELNLTDAELSNRHEYKTGKNGTFSVIYGADRATANATYELPDGYERVISRFPEIGHFAREKHREFQKNGFITTLYGYPLRVPEDEPHVSVSAFVQGSAGCIMRAAMIGVQNYLDECEWAEVNIVNQVHDELILDLPSIPDPLYSLMLQRIEGIMHEAGDAVGVPTPVKTTILEFPQRWSGE